MSEAAQPDEPDGGGGGGGATRRERFGFRKEGTGREPRVRDFGLGARTGWLMPSALPKDKDGFDDLDALLAMGAPAAAGKAKPPARGAGASSSSSGGDGDGGAEGMHAQSLSPMGGSHDGDGAEFLAAAASRGSHAAPGAPRTVPKLGAPRGAGDSPVAADDGGGGYGGGGGGGSGDYDAGPAMEDDYGPAHGYEEEAGGAAKAARTRPPPAASAMAKAGVPKKHKRSVTIRDDDDGGDDDDDAGARGGAGYSSSSSARRRGGGQQREADDDDDDDGGGGGGGGRYRNDEADEDAGFRRKQAKKKQQQQQQRSKGASSKSAAVSGRPRGRPAKQQPRSRERDGEEGEEEDDDIDDGPTARARPSMHVGSMIEAGRGKRRRWAPLNHWKNERLQYDEFGAVKAEKLGPVTPVVDKLGKRKRSVSQSRSPKRGGKGASSKSGGGALRKVVAGGRAVRSSSQASSEGRGSDDERAQEEEAERGRSASRASSKAAGGSGRGRSSSQQNQQQHTKRGPGRPPKVAAREARAAGGGDDVNDDDAGEEDGGRGAGARPAQQSTAPLSASRLPRGFKEAATPTLTVPATDGNPMYQIAVVRRASNLAFEMLPSATERAPGLEAVAAAAFDAPEFISGIVKLPPGSVKDEESTHNCTQVFVVRAGQDRALQVTIARQHYLLSPGDHFFVPQATLYSMVNHSGSTEAEVAFTVIKPSRAPSGDEDALMDEEGGAMDDSEAAAAGAAAAAGGGSPMPQQPHFGDAEVAESGQRAGAPVSARRGR